MHLFWGFRKNLCSLEWSKVIAVSFLLVVYLRSQNKTQNESNSFCNLTFAWLLILATASNVTNWWWEHYWKTTKTLPFTCIDSPKENETFIHYEQEKPHDSRKPNQSSQNEKHKLVEVGTPYQLPPSKSRLFWKFFFPFRVGSFYMTYPFSRWQTDKQNGLKRDDINVCSFVNEFKSLKFIWCG